MPQKKRGLKPDEISDHEDEFSQTSVLFEIENVTCKFCFLLFLHFAVIKRVILYLF